MGLGKLVLRATIGGYFFGHGMQKLAGWFGGDGPEETGQYFEQVGLRPGRESALLAGAAEAGGGLLLAAGLFTPVAVSKVVMGAGAAGAVYFAEHGPELFEARAADESLSRATEKVGAES